MHAPHPSLALTILAVLRLVPTHETSVSGYHLKYLPLVARVLKMLVMRVGYVLRQRNFYENPGEGVAVVELLHWALRGYVQLYSVVAEKGVVYRLHETNAPTHLIAPSISMNLKFCGSKVDWTLNYKPSRHTQRSSVSIQIGNKISST